MGSAFRRWLSAGCALALAALGSPPEALAFPHVVVAGETLASIAERIYGRVEAEKLLVAANSLDAGGGVHIVPGMRLEVPSVGHHRVAEGETWPSLAQKLLGDADRSDAFALANDAMPWVAPADGTELIVPYNLRIVAQPGDTTLTVAYRYLGDRDKAWMLDRYNRLRGKPLARGRVVLVPLTDLALTPEGKAEAAAAVAMVRGEAGGHARETQRRAEAELPLLATDVRTGRWVEAVTRGSRLLGTGELTRPQTGVIQRELTEAYAALGAVALAESACRAWREADPSAVLDPVELSPKILRACTAASLPDAPTRAAAPAPPAAKAAASGARPGGR